MSSAAHSHEALLPKQQKQLLHRLEAFGEIRTYRKDEVPFCSMHVHKHTRHSTDALVVVIVVPPNPACLYYANSSTRANTRTALAHTRRHAQR